MAIVNARIPDPLIEAARECSGLPDGSTVAALLRFALARLAGWPEAAARTVAKPAGGAR